MRPLSALLALAGAGSAALAACGPVAQNQPHPMLDLPPSAAASVAVETSPPPPSRPAGEKSTSLIASQMKSDLQKLGLDPLHLPTFATMTLDQKKGLMPLFAKALGYAKAGDPGCSGCHVQGDFKAETHNRALSRQMYDRWSVGLGFSASGANQGTGDLLFCDSCHAQKPKVLDRSDAAAMRAFMKAEYVEKLLVRPDGPTACATCHSADLELAIFSKVWKVAP